MTSPRRDAGPRPDSYPDTGCEVSPSCFTCPLPACKYERRHYVRRLRTAQRRDEIVRMYQTTGLSAVEVGRRVGVARRTVLRALQEARKGAS
jgi:hypothetical protein